eukprot:1204206-Rhodomonas_salina.1
MVHLQLRVKALSISASAVAFRFPASWSHNLARLAGALAECRSLQHLDLRGNICIDENGVSLAAVLEGLKDLRFFDLSENKFQGRVAGAEFVLSALAGCHQLCELNLEGVMGCDADDIARSVHCS